MIWFGFLRKVEEFWIWWEYVLSESATKKRKCDLLNSKRELEKQERQHKEKKRKKKKKKPFA